MQVYKTFFTILKKQLTPILIYGAIFLALTYLTTLSQRNQDNEQFQEQKVDALLVNKDIKSEFLQEFTSYLEKYVTFVEIEDTEEARRDALFYRKVYYILTIPEGFTEAFLKGEEISLIKQIVPDSYEAMSVDSIINNYLNTVRVYRKHIPEADFSQLSYYVEKNLELETKVAFDVILEDENRKSIQFNKNYYNYLGYIMLAVFIISVSSVMLSFQNLNIRRRHHASPVTLKNINLQLILGNLAFVMIYMAVFIIAGYLFNPFRRVDTNLLLYILNAAVFAMTALGISYLVSMTITSKRAVSAISTAVSLSLAFISGMFVPQDYLGASVLKVASFTPTYWYIKANNTIQTLTSFSWDNISGVFGMMAIQLGFAAAIFSVALVVSKRKSQQAT
ncbi:MAG: hypothetical protein K0S76_2847 [Herbinix sp.]|nr:hypothetical protein [Herbinix sp.]